MNENNNDQIKIPNTIDDLTYSEYNLLQIYNSLSEENKKTLLEELINLSEE